MQRINNPYSYWLSLYSTRLTERTSSRATTNEQVAPLYKCGNPMLFSTPTHTCRQMPTCFTLIQPPHLITVPLPLEAHICSPSPPMHTQREAHHRHNTEMHVQAGAGSSRFNPSPKPSSSLVCQGVGGVPGWGCCPPSTSWARAIEPRCELWLLGGNPRHLSCAKALAVYLDGVVALHLHHGHEPLIQDATSSSVESCESSPICWPSSQPGSDGVALACANCGAGTGDGIVGVWGPWWKWRGCIAPLVGRCSPGVAPC
jgi:hypothetical protein